MPSARSAVAALGLLLLAACAHEPAQRAGGPLRIVATTSTLASIVRGAAGASADVRSLVPVGVSPEDFEPSPDTVAALRDADVLVENGAGLEGWLQTMIRNAANPRLRVVVCTDGLPVANANPHLWMDPVYARTYAGKIRDALIAADVPHTSAYRSASAAYDAQLVALASRTRAKLATIPASHRTMIVFHDAFDYYARRFGLRIAGAIEPLPGAEPNPAHIAELVRQARAENVRAVFAEHEYSDKLAHTVASSAGGLKVAFLYDDSLAPGEGVASYVGMIDVDTDTIVSALK
ncbi:MAG TPA: metal ABC transporter substrate-binding protein [Candidatus Elarobacter sp.]|jgi:ABC-type Zn uptake system ZnuABC Zn-binding protein ZnuA|nr:metal ABC transporter substrate-binding protein [Candidatus Elarobacter sp.]